MATARIILDTRKAKLDGTYPVKIRVAHVKDFKRLGTSVSLTQNDFDKIAKGTNLKDNLKKAKAKLDKLIEKANQIIESLDPFDFDAFNTRFTQKGNRSDLIFLLTSKAEEFANDDKFSSESLYKQAAGLLTEYINRGRSEKAERLNVLPINLVTPKWLADLEKWALKVMVESKSKKGTSTPKYSKTTLSMYLIRVRAVFNDVISKKELGTNAYPFFKADNKLGYKIPKAVNNKRALSIDKIMELYNYEPVNTGEEFSKDIFIFSYLASGMNMTDIFKLQWSDKERGRIMRLTNQRVIKIESPVCLVKEHKGPCNHNWCMMVYNKPEFYGINIVDYYKKHEFSEFDVMAYGTQVHLIPHKPVDAAPGFELFRQAMNAVINLGGEWPSDLKTVPREHVEIRWAEHEDKYPAENIVTLKTEWLPCVDVSQFAFYIGPGAGDEKGVCHDNQRINSIATSSCIQVPGALPPL